MTTPSGTLIVDEARTVPLAKAVGPVASAGVAPPEAEAEAPAAASTERLLEAFARRLPAKIRCEMMVLAELSHRSVLRVRAVWPEGKRERAGCGEVMYSDEGLLNLCQRTVDAVVYTSTSVAASDLARILYRGGCRSAVALPLTSEEDGRLCVLALGLTVASAELAEPLRDLLSLVEPCPPVTGSTAGGARIRGGA